MPSRNNPVTSQETTPTFDPEKDRFPTLHAVLRMIQMDAELPDGPIEKLEVYLLASGEATYRVWAARAEEPTVGYWKSVG